MLDAPGKATSRTTIEGGGNPLPSSSRHRNQRVVTTRWREVRKCPTVIGVAIYLD